jgi:glycosyltransferase involved in cell wall biosynthesis
LKPVLSTPPESKQLLIIGWGWPEPNATAAGVRMLQLANYFLERSYEVTFVATAVENEYSLYLETLGIRTKQVVLNSDSFNEFIVELNPNIVLFDRFLSEEQFGWRVTEHAPDALRILDTEDLHSLRYVRELCFKQNIPFAADIWLKDDKTKREVASIYRCDLSLIISDFEMNLLKVTLGIDESLLMHLPFMVGKDDIPIKTPSFEERSDFVFIGGGKHLPNLDAIKYLKKDIWPKIKTELPNAKLNIYGAYLPLQIMEFNDALNGFNVLGKANNVSKVLQKAKVCLAPLRFGAGIKGKLLHAMKFGTPSVTTSIGAEGMHGDLDWNGLIADKQTDFVTAAVALYSNKTEWQKAQRNGNALLASRFHKTTIEHALDLRLSQLYTNLKNHRSQNFIGSLLQHQTMASTKFMSKWIQEKNKP